MHRASGESLVHVKEVLYHTYANIEELSRLKGAGFRCAHGLYCPG